MRAIRRIFWSVMVLLFLVSFAGSAIQSQNVMGVAILGMMVWWFTGTFFSRILGAMFISSIRCRGCGLEMPAVDRWQIGSYTDHRQRHFLFAKNPIDGVRIGHVNCPNCSASIIL